MADRESGVTKVDRADLNIAVITVCLNCEHEIERTIESVYQQEQENYEYIIQDGMSQDCTMEKIRKYEEKFAEKKIPFIVNSQRDEGIYHAMNLAAGKCRAEYLLFLNAGDVLCHKKVFSILRAASDKKKADIYYGDALMVDKSGTRLFKADMALISQRMPFSHQACFISRECFLKQMYDPRYNICADYDLILRLYEKKRVFEKMDTIVCRYDLDGASSCLYIEKRREHEQILKEHGLNTSNLRCGFHMVEAYIKKALDIILPQKILYRFRQFYMDKVKHYEYWGGEIY